MKIHGNVKCNCGNRWSIHNNKEKEQSINCAEFQPNKRYTRKLKIIEALKRQLTLF